MKLLTILISTHLILSCAALAELGFANFHSAIAISPDSKTLWVGGKANVVFECSLDDLSIKKRHYHGKPINTITATKTNRLVVATSDSRYQSNFTIYDTSNMEKPLKAGGSSMKFWATSPDGKWFAFGSHTKITILNLNDGSERSKLEDLDKPIQSICFTPDSKRLITFATVTREPISIDLPESPSRAQEKEKKLKAAKNGIQVQLLDIDSGQSFFKGDHWWNQRSYDEWRSQCTSDTLILSGQNSGTIRFPFGEKPDLEKGVLFCSDGGPFACTESLFACATYRSELYPAIWQSKSWDADPFSFSKTGDKFFIRDLTISKDNKIYSVTEHAHVAVFSPQGELLETKPIY